MGPQSKSRALMKPEISTGRVLVDSLPNTTGMRNSFQASKPTNSAVAAMPGNATGSTIFKKTVREEAPSTTAASSSSAGIPWK